MIDVLAKVGFYGIDFNADKPEYYTDVRFLHWMPSYLR